MSRLTVMVVDHEPRLGGGERNIVDLVRGLDPADVRVHAVVHGEGPFAAALAQHGVDVHVVPVSDSLLSVSRWELQRRPDALARHAVASVSGSAKLARVIRSIRPDVVHSSSLKAHLLAVPAAAITRTPLVWHVQDILEPGWLSRAFGIAARGAARVVCLSHATASGLDNWRFDDRVRVIYPGVHVSIPPAGDVAAARSSLGGSDSEVLVGIVGQLAAWKGQDVFVAAASAVANRRRDVRFAVVGDCLYPTNERPYLDALTRAAARLGDRIRLVGHVEPIGPVMGALDVLVHASTLPEPFGRVMVEAMTLGTPVITTSVGAGPEIVTEGAGAVVPPGDARATATAIECLVTEPGRLAKAGNAARHAAARFNPEAAARSMLQVWREVAR